MKVVVLPLPQPHRLQIVEDDHVLLERVFDANWDLVKGQLEVPGFEKGAIPRSVAEKKVGVQTLYQVGIKQLVDKGVTESRLEVCEITEVAVDWYDDQKPLALYITCLLRPKIVSSEYSSLELNYEKLATSELEIESQLHRLAFSEANEIPSLEPIVEDDIVDVDFGIYDATTKEKLGEQSDYQFRPSKSLYGFEASIISKKCGDALQAETEIPNSFFSDELRGKKVLFDIVIKKVVKLDVPPIDDRLARLVGFADLATLKTSLRQDISKEKEKADDLLYKDALYSMVLEKTEISAIPDSLVKQELDEMLYVQLLELSKKHKQQITAEIFLKKSGTTKEQWQMMYWGRAVRKIKMHLLLNHVFEKEQLIVTEEERQQAVVKLAPNVPREQLDMRLIDTFLRKEKAQDFLLSRVTKKISNG